MNDNEAVMKLLAKVQAENLQLKHANMKLRDRVREVEAERDAIVDAVRSRTETQ